MIYTAISFLTNENAPAIALFIGMLLFIYLVYRINIWAEKIRVKKRKEFEAFLLKYDERQGF